MVKASFAGFVCRNGQYFVHTNCLKILCLKWKSEINHIFMNIWWILGMVFLPFPLLLEGIHEDWHTTCELFWVLKMEIHIFGGAKKTKAAKLQVDLQTNWKKAFKKSNHDKIQILNCVAGCFNVQMAYILVEIIDLQIFRSLKWESV